MTINDHGGPRLRGHERRVLNEIAQRLAADDPAFCGMLRHGTPVARTRRCGLVGCAAAMACAFLGLATVAGGLPLLVGTAAGFTLMGTAITWAARRTEHNRRW